MNKQTKYNKSKKTFVKKAENKKSKGFANAHKEKTPQTKMSGLWLFGIHPIKAGILNPQRKVLELRTTQDTYDQLPQSEIIKQKIDVKIFAKSDIAKMAPVGAIHQGVIARFEPLPYKTIDDVIAELEPSQKSTIVILDQVTDPHNVGAILRSSAIFGVTAVVVPDKNAPEETGVLAKTASGALEKIDYIRSGNLKRTIDILKNAGFWCVGFDGNSDKILTNFKPDNRTVIIIGAEGSGMRRLTKQSCDHLIKIDTVGADEILDSLNVSNATAIALYALTQK